MRLASRFSIACRLLFSVGCLTPLRAQRPQTHPEIKVSGRNLLVDGAPWHFKGVCWNPIPFAGEHPKDQDFLGYADLDGDLMKNAGMNAVRTYDPISDLTVLDKLWERGIFVVMNVYIWGEFEPGQDVVDRVNAVKDHPSILFWEVGNEWNYNNLYQNEKLTLKQARDRVKRAVDIIKQTDDKHPVATNMGELSVFKDMDLDLFGVLHNVDLWGINVYRNASFGGLFADWMDLSDKPMYIGEFGVDAWDSRPEVSSANMKAHADGTRWLQEELVANSVIYGGATFGGWIFELADEWWKDTTKKNTDIHDVGGIAPGGGPYPDLTFNEEWWGLVDLWRAPRPAYFEYAKIPNPVSGHCPKSGPGSMSAKCISDAQAQAKQEDASRWWPSNFLTF